MIIILLVICIWFLVGGDEVWVHEGIVYLSGLSGLAYIFSRLMILVLTFYCFTAPPQNVYEGVEWTGFLPHFT